MSAFSIDLAALADVVAEKVIERLDERATQRKQQLITPAEMAARLSVTVKTLANQRCEGKGPPWKKVAGRVRYVVD